MRTWKTTTKDGRVVELTWSCAQTSYPTGALDENASRRTRYFFDVVVDDLYYYGNRFVTSPDAEGATDVHGTPILTRLDLILPLCADMVVKVLDSRNIDNFPNDLGLFDLDDLVRAGQA